METKIIENQRIESADVYRGFVMLLMMAEVLELAKVAENNSGSTFWSILAWHQSHVEWVGCSLHDMIQPSFSFLVGVVLPYSISNYKLKTSASNGIFRAIKRSLILILLGVFLRSMHSESTNWTFDDTLTQIGFGYTFLYLLAWNSPRFQIISCILILVLYWLAFAIYPLPAANFDYNSAGVVQNWEHNLNGFAAHWNKNTNLAWAFDRWFMNIWPRTKVFEYSGGGYATISFIPTLATMLLGLLAGNIFKTNLPNTEKLKKFLLYGIVLILSGLAIHFLGICPIVKRIWTPAWVLFSGGVCFLFLSIFYFIIDMKNYRRPFFWLKIIGMNSIAAYVMAHTITEFIKNSFEIHFGNQLFGILGAGKETLVSGTIILFFLWLILYWMFKKKLFIRI